MSALGKRGGSITMIGLYQAIKSVAEAHVVTQMSQEYEMEPGIFDACRS